MNSNKQIRWEIIKKRKRYIIIMEDYGCISNLEFLFLFLIGREAMGKTGERISRISLWRGREMQKLFFSLYHRNWQKFWENVIVNNLKAPEKIVLSMDLGIFEFHFIVSLVTP